MDLLARGIVLGLAIAAPVGPIGMLCIQRGLSQGFAAALAGGAGTALADAVYAALGAAGLVALLASFEALAPWLRYGGCGLLIWLGVQTLRRPAALQAAIAPGAADLLRSFAITFTLTMVNPATLLSFLALFAGLGLGPDAPWQDGALLVGGVFAGSLAWWVFLSTLVAWLRRGVSAAWLQRINWLSGGGLIVLALWLLLQ
ncbi:LysE family translocator [Ferrovibrio sp.]|uniref:LysE family translocator n=1 Tax=Ferrovibrio sp. TaxID=1917215 RepID=UPI0035AFC1BA